MGKVDLINAMVAAAIIGLLSWNTLTTQSLAVDMAVMKTEVKTALSLQSDINDIKVRLIKLEDATSTKP